MNKDRLNSMVQSNRSKLVSAIPSILSYDNKLNSLYGWWGKITLIGKICSRNLNTGILKDMQETREKFGELQKKLVHNLIKEQMNKLVINDSAKAQVAIDILIRNLFERTADVGFLATDEDIRAFLLKGAFDSASTEKITSRLGEYAAKYSVYDEIIILDTKGNIKANLDPENRTNFSRDPLIHKTLSCSYDFIETFRYSNLQPGKKNSLIYSCRITESNSDKNSVIGVLCLCFRFEDEMESIFKNLISDSESTILSILDDKGAVIASSDQSRLPSGTILRDGGSEEIISYRGAEYISCRRETRGYQGFYGQSWSGMAMSSLFKSFSAGEEHNDDTSADSDNITKNSEIFSSELHEIELASSNINSDLRLVALNGKITATRKKSVELMPVLNEIMEIGEKTASIFSASIKDLHTTVISSMMSDVRFMASLAADIMDRNLYERANDCRWWALTSDFRKILSKPQIEESDRKKISLILAYINELYTVYTNLYIYDMNCRIIAVSNPDENGIIGTAAPEESGAKAALKIYDSQKYVVSEFLPTPLYGKKETYIYNAPITDIENPEKIVGGIGIVFDSSPQFKAMLDDALPKNEKGEVIEGCFGLFTDRRRKIISSTENSPAKTGELLDLKGSFFSMGNGKQSSEIVIYRERAYAAGYAVSGGYREYKRVDGYSNDVIAFIFVPL